jgi:Domain of unknown function (DUF4375)
MPYPEDFDDLLLPNKEEFRHLPRNAQVALCIHALEAEVNNGGFHQFFSNSSGEYVRETLAALSAVDAPKTRELLEHAIAVAFPGGYPTDAGSYQDALVDYDEVADALEVLDSRFFSYSEPLTDLVNAYLSRAA